MEIENDSMEIAGFHSS